MSVGNDQSYAVVLSILSAEVGSRNPKVLMHCALSALVGAAAVWRNGQCDGSENPHLNRGIQ